jgi:hypothetical protein
MPDDEPVMRMVWSSKPMSLGSGTGTGSGIA